MVLDSQSENNGATFGLYLMYLIYSVVKTSKTNRILVAVHGDTFKAFFWHFLSDI